MTGYLFIGQHIWSLLRLILKAWMQGPPMLATGLLVGVAVGWYLTPGRRR